MGSPDSLTIGLYTRSVSRKKNSSHWLPGARKAGMVPKKYQLWAHFPADPNILWPWNLFSLKASWPDYQNQKKNLCDLLWKNFKLNLKIFLTTSKNLPKNSNFGPGNGLFEMNLWKWCRIMLRIIFPLNEIEILTQQTP